MKHLKYISIISIMALITAPAVADIASAEYVDSVVGTMTQSAINTALANKQDKLPNGPNDGKKYSLIWNGSGFAFEEFTTGGGSSTPIDWDAISAYIGDPESNPNYTSASYGFKMSQEYMDELGFALPNYCSGSHGYDADIEDGKWFGLEFDGNCNFPEFAGMVAGDWYYDLPSPINVKIEGRALCSSTSKPSTGGSHPVGDPDGSGTGAYCWCKMTAPAASRWVYCDNWGEDYVDGCMAICAARCEYFLQSRSDFRSAMFGSVGD